MRGFFNILHKGFFKKLYAISRMKFAKFDKSKIMHADYDAPRLDIKRDEIGLKIKVEFHPFKISLV